MPFYTNCFKRGDAIVRRHGCRCWTRAIWISPLSNKGFLSPCGIHSSSFKSEASTTQSNTNFSMYAESVHTFNFTLSYFDRMVLLQMIRNKKAPLRRLQFSKNQNLGFSCRSFANLNFISVVIMHNQSNSDCSD